MRDKGIKEILKTALSLFLICAVAAGILAYVNSITAPTIAKNSEDTANRSRGEVLSEAERFEEITLENGEAAYKGLIGDETAGYVFICSAPAYNGQIEVMTGIAADGKITGVKILTINETPGLGMNAQKPSFLQQYQNKSAALQVVKGAANGENEISALTSATISSKAVTNAVNEALNLFSQLKEGQ